MKIFALIGKSASGKSTIERELVKKGFDRIISTTTRPIRQGEINCIDYFYITKEEFNKGLGNNEFIEHAEYNGWSYGINKKSININNKCYVTVVEPHGFKQLEEYYGADNVIGIYIKANDKKRLIRSLTREENPDCKEICRRFLSDIELFKSVQDTIKYTIDNEVLENSIRHVVEIIKENIN